VSDFYATWYVYRLRRTLVHTITDLELENEWHMRGIATWTVIDLHCPQIWRIRPCEKRSTLLIVYDWGGLRLDNMTLCVVYMNYDYDVCIITYAICMLIPPCSFR
jgi:hypothetical protein